MNNQKISSIENLIKNGATIENTEQKSNVINNSCSSKSTVINEEKKHKYKKKNILNKNKNE